MSEDFHKFIFLGVIISLAVFSNHGSLYGQKAAVADPQFFAKKPAPLFVFDRPTVESAKSAPSLTPFVALGEQLASVSESSKPVPIREEKRPDTAREPLQSQNSPSLGFKKIKGDEPPQVVATVALVSDLRSGDEFFSIGKEKRWPIASITKLMSAAIVSKEFAFHQSTTLIEADFLIEGSDKNMKAGSRYTVADLVAAMLLESSNESAEALARLYGKGVFVAAMNTLAEEWGVSDIHFDDPTGLSSTNQSTASDLRKAALNIYDRYPDIFRMTRKQASVITELNSGKKFPVKNINLMVARPDFLGGKTGYIDEAGGNLLSIFSYNRRPVIIIVLGSNDRFGDTEKLLGWFEKNYR